MSDDLPRWPAERGGRPLPVPAPLQCSGARCRTRRAEAIAAWTPAADVAPQFLRAGTHFFECLNPSCATGAFLYPRKPRKENENNAAEQPVFHFHQGVDIGGPVDNGTGTLISVVSGTVMEPTVQNGYGQTIHIADDTGRYWYKYAHCHTVSVHLDATDATNTLELAPAFPFSC